MAQPEKTEIAIRFSHGKPYEQRVSWPVLESTAKAWRIQTPGGVIWVPVWQWNNLYIPHGENANAMKLNAVLGYFRRVTSTEHGARVIVRRAGKGASDLSVTVAYSVERRCLNSQQDLGSRQQTTIVAASQLSQDGRQLTAPFWLIKKKLKDGEWLEVPAVWLGMSAIQSQLQAAYDAAVAGEVAAAAAAIAVAQAAAKQRADKQLIEAAEKANRLALIDEDGELALVFARRRLTLGELESLGARLHSLPSWLPGQPVDNWLERSLSQIVVAVRTHPDFAAWRAKNSARKGTLLKAPKPRKPAPARVPDRIIMNCTVQ